mmetsp:Transcript_10430/g.24785  ORF Transcript_10430/g.24785 Transcript_10430/m.24785 type:complete len:299 (-) Transcript_10430:175-1071(-)
MADVSIPPVGPHRDCGGPPRSSKSEGDSEWLVHSDPRCNKLPGIFADPCDKMGMTKYPDPGFRRHQRSLTRFWTEQNWNIGAELRRSAQGAQLGPCLVIDHNQGLCPSLLRSFRLLPEWLPVAKPNNASIFHVHIRGAAGALPRSQSLAILGHQTSKARNATSAELCGAVGWALRHFQHRNLRVVAVYNIKMEVRPLAIAGGTTPSNVGTGRHPVANTTADSFWGEMEIPCVQPIVVTQNHEISFASHRIPDSTFGEAALHIDHKPTSSGQNSGTDWQFKISGEKQRPRVREPASKPL